MAQTIRRKNCKTRREWALKKVENAPLRDGEDWTKFAARIVADEHAMAVRIVKRLQKNAERGEFGLAYGVALKDVLAALQKGRA